MDDIKDYIEQVEDIKKKAIEENEIRNMKNFFMGKAKEDLVIKLPPPPMFHLIIGTSLTINN